MLAITSVVTAGLMAATAQGVLAANFSISGMPFVITSPHLEGTGFEQYAQLDSMREDNPNIDPKEGPDKLVMVSAIDKAKLFKLCQSVSLGGGFLKITAGDQPNKPVYAESLVVGSTKIDGDADFKNINVGQDSATMDKVQDRANIADGDIITGGSGVFGQQADEVVLDNLRQENFSTTAAKFVLPHLRMSFSPTGC